MNIVLILQFNSSSSSSSSGAISSIFKVSVSNISFPIKFIYVSKRLWPELNKYYYDEDTFAIFLLWKEVKGGWKLNEALWDTDGNYKSLSLDSLFKESIDF